MVLLPVIKYDEKKFTKYDNIRDQDIWTPEAIKFGKKLFKNLVDIDKALRKGGEKTPPPDWVKVNEFELQEESSLMKKIEAATHTVDTLLTKRNQLTIQLDEVVKLKDLVFEKGKNLENAITSALIILGYSAENYNDGNLEVDHVIVSPEGDRFIGEAEGKDTAAVNIDKLRQLSLNIHEDAQREEVEIPAVGILFGNGFRLKKPEEREEQFTTKCIAVAKSSSCILIKTSDLFYVARYVKESGDKEFSKVCREVIKCSKGEIVKFPKIPE